MGRQRGCSGPPRPLIPVLGVLLLALNGCSEIAGPKPSASPAGSMDARLHLVGLTVIRALGTRDFTETGRIRVQGFRGNDGRCGFVSRIHLKPGQEVTEMLAEADTATCEFLFARGIFRGSTVASQHRADTLRLSRTQPGSPLKPLELGCDGSYGYDTSDAEQHLWFNDPLGVTVNSDDNHVTWSYDYIACVRPGALEIHETSWDVSTQWQQTGQYDSFGYTDWPDLWEAIAEASSSYANTWWSGHYLGCLPGETDVAYYANNITVDADGSANFDFGYVAGGNCSSLLTGFRRAFVNGVLHLD